MMYPYYYNYGFNIWNFLWHIVSIVFVIWIIWLIVRMMFCGPRRNRRWRHNWHAYPALEVLDERYAKGEISKEEYEERKKTLLGD